MKRQGVPALHSCHTAGPHCLPVHLPKGKQPANTQRLHATTLDVCGVARRRRCDRAGAGPGSPTAELHHGEVAIPQICGSAGCATGDTLVTRAVPHSSWNMGSKLFRAYMAVCGTLAFVSVPLYVFVPFGTAQNFSGGDMAPMPREQAWWVQTVAAGDLLVAYLCWVAFWQHKNRVVTTLVMRGVAVYTLLHMLAFWRGAVLAGKSVATYAVSVAIVLAALAAWGDLLPGGAKQGTE